MDGVEYIAADVFEPEAWRPLLRFPPPPFVLSGHVASFTPY